MKWSSQQISDLLMVSWKMRPYIRVHDWLSVSSLTDEFALENWIFIYMSLLITTLTWCDYCDNYSRLSGANLLFVVQTRSTYFVNTVIVVLADLVMCFCPCVVPPVRPPPLFCGSGWKCRHPIYSAVWKTVYFTCDTKWVWLYWVRLCRNACVPSVLVGVI